MYKLVYFDGSELKLRQIHRLSTVLNIAKKNPNVYQVVKMNRDQKVVWEREAEEV